MSICLPESHRVVAIPRVKNCLLGSAWNGPGLVERGWAVVSLSCRVLVERLEVDGPPERPVFLGAHHHSVAPSHGCAQGNLLQDS